MEKSQLCSKLAIERCRMYLAQLFAASYLKDDHSCEGSCEDAVVSILKGLHQNLDVLETLVEERDV